MSSFMRAAGHRLTSLVRTSTRFCLRIDSGQLAVPTSSTMWVSRFDPRCGHQNRVSLMARRHPEARTTSSRGAAGCPGHWGRRQRTLPLHDERLWVGWLEGL